MTLEYKAVPQFTKAISDRTVTGIFAVHGHVDDGNDRTWPGLFSDPKIAGRMRARFVWQHRTDDPPTAAIRSITEVGRDALPPAVLSYAGDATGGVEVIREYLDTPRGNEILAGIKAGAIEEMSYAYDPIKFDFEQTDNRGMVRNLYKASLYDISDVLWGMNPATVAAKRMPLADHSEAVLAAVADFTKRLKDLSDLRAKEGRVLSGENRKRITDAVAALKDASQALDDLLAATEPQKSGGRAELNQLRAAHVAQQQRLRELGVSL